MKSAKKPIDLDRVGVASPCNESWEGMKGDDKIRYCDRCELNVFNLSGMDRGEATELVSKTEGELCVRFHRRSDGTMLTQDCPVGLAAKTGRWLRSVVAGMFALIGFLPSCTTEQESEAATPATNQQQSTSSPTEPRHESPINQGSMEMGEFLMGDIDILEAQAPNERRPLLGKISFAPETAKPLPTEKPEENR